MTIGVVGLVVLQLMWISDVREQTQQQFEEKVFSSLEKSVKDIEDVEALNLMSPDAFKQGLQGSYTDFVKAEFGEVMAVKEAISVRDTIIFQAGQPMHFLVVQGTTIDSATGITAEHKVITKNLDEITPTEIENSVVGVDETNGFAIQLNQSFERQIMNKANHVNEMMMKLFTGNFFDDITLRINSVVLDSLVARNLKSSQLDTGFIYNIVDDKNKVVELPKTSKHYDSTLTQSKYKVQLFPSDVVSNDHYLMVSLPSENIQIWKTMIGTLLGSILLVLIVIVAFYIAVSTIYKQKKLSEIKNDFINNMTHELKTPISTISLACEAAKDPDVGADKEVMTSFITMIDEENKRLGKLVENVLQTALIDKGKLKLNKEVVPVNELVKNTISSFELKYKEVGGAIEIDQLDIVKWELDKIHFSNVLFNLLDNALKYCAKTPKVQVSLAKMKNGFSILIKDNGIGIDKENEKKIFEKLYRVPTGNVHNVKGFGLGLSYVKAVLDLHGGIISVDSEVGEGSTFKITMNHE